MIRQDARQFVSSGTINSNEGIGGDEILLLDESMLRSVTVLRMNVWQEFGRFVFQIPRRRDSQEHWLEKNTGLSYAIVRVSGFNESSSGEFSMIQHGTMSRSSLYLETKSLKSLAPTICLNKSFSVSKKKVAATTRICGLSLRHY
jgi:hypothetical protein